MVPYLARIGVIPKTNQGSFHVLESDLLLNRLARYIDIEQPYLKICTYSFFSFSLQQDLSSSVLLLPLSTFCLGPLHRYTFGVGWKDHNNCAHLDHKYVSSQIKEMKKKRKTSGHNRIAPFHLVRYLEQFPYGGRLCASHVNKTYSLIEEQQSAADELNAFSEVHTYQIRVDAEHELDKTNALLLSLEQSPLKSQTMIPLEEQAPGAVRRLTSKLRQVVSVAGISLK